jgi:hypothetical protein
MPIQNTSLRVIYTNCEQCGNPLSPGRTPTWRRCLVCCGAVHAPVPADYPSQTCRQCSLLHWDWFRARPPLPAIPSDKPVTPVVRRPTFTADDLSDFDRRGEYFERDGSIQWRF